MAADLAGLGCLLMVNDGEVTVLGQQNYLEVWNRTDFESNVLSKPLTDEELDELAGLGF